MRISLDLDGCLSDFVTPVVEIANELWPGKLPEYFQPIDWDFSNGLTKLELSSVFEEIRNIEDFWSDLPGYTENVQALRSFLENQQGHDIFYVTSRMPTEGRSVCIQSEEWLVVNELWPEANYHAVIPVKDPSIKRYVMADLDIEFSLDDCGPTVEACNDVVGHKAYLLDRPWNQDKSYGTRVFNLQQFFNMTTGKTPADYYVS